MKAKKETKKENLSTVKKRQRRYVCQWDLSIEKRRTQAPSLDTRRSSVDRRNHRSITLLTGQNWQWSRARLYSAGSIQSVSNLWSFSSAMHLTDSSFRNLTEISRLEPFVHLRFIDLSNNRLRTVTSLNRLKFLLTLKLDNNELSIFDLPPFPYLQSLTLSNNRLRSASGIEQPRLETLNLTRKGCLSIESISGLSL